METAAIVVGWTTAREKAAAEPWTLVVSGVGEVDFLTFDTASGEEAVERLAEHVRMFGGDDAAARWLGARLRQAKVLSVMPTIVLAWYEDQVGNAGFLDVLG